MRVPTDIPRRPSRSRRGRSLLIVAAVILIFLIFSARGLAGFYTDYLWFNQLGFSDVFTGLLSAKIFLAVVFTVAMFALLLINLVVADRLAPKFRSLGPEDELVQRYHDTVGQHVGKVRLGVAVVFALILGTGQSAQWNSWILYRNAKSFGIKDPQFHKDIGFFVFKLPFLQFLVSWSFAAVVVTTFVTAIFHYLNGGIRLQAPAQRVSPQVKAHLSVLLGLLALIKAAGYWYQRYALDFSNRGPIEGATYTDIHAQLPALKLLIFIMIVAFIAFIVNIRLKGWTLPVLGVGLWFFVSVVVGAIYPALIQQLTVKPSENKREQPYIQRNITATRVAMGINKVVEKPFNYNESLTPTDIDNNAQTIRNVRLWDPALTLQTYSELQKLRQYYSINSTDIDRYNLGGSQTQTLLSVRELNQDDLPQNSWVNKHLQFTHGYGEVLAPANAVTPDGFPVFAIKDLPPTIAPGAPSGTPSLSKTGSAVYFGEQASTFSIVNTKQKELDYQSPDGSNVETSYTGTGGVRISSALRRLAFAIRFGDQNILLSGQIDNKSRVLYIRDINSRIRKAAPFLHLDNDPYAVILNGRLVWVQDAYTITNNYPYAQGANVDRLPSSSGLKTSFNYVRNSVKVVVDAYDGSTTYYVQDPTDPVIRAYESAFPKLFQPKAKMPPDLVSHLRYPEDLFKVQTTAYGRYHISDPNAFYGSSDAWNVAQDPGVGKADAQISRTAQTSANGALVPGTVRQARQDPFYQVIKLPNEGGEEFQILQPFVPQSNNDDQKNLTGFMVAKSDPDDYGQLEVFRMPSGIRVSGPAQVDAQIQQDPTVSQAISLLNTNNSEADYGNILTIPINQSLLYIRPLYVKSGRNPIPQLKKIIAVYGAKVAYQDTLQQALSFLFPGISPTLTQEQAASATPTTPTTTPGSGPATTAPPTVVTGASSLLATAQKDFTDADAALKTGDLGTYKTKIDAAQAATASALAALANTTPPTTAPKTTPPTTAAGGPPATTGVTTAVAAPKSG
jgi:uncharacterized membrane protein (UPF0182 family)